MLTYHLKESFIDFISHLKADLWALNDSYRFLYTQRIEALMPELRMIADGSKLVVSKYSMQQYTREQIKFLVTMHYVFTIDHKEIGFSTSLTISDFLRENDDYI